MNALIINDFVEEIGIDKTFGQYLKLSFRSYDIVTVYKTHNCTTISDIQQFVQILQELVDVSKPTIINGDFNFDYWKEKQNLVRVAMEASGFRQLVTEPTTLRGNCIHAF